MILIAEKCIKPNQFNNKMMKIKFNAIAVFVFLLVFASCKTKEKGDNTKIEERKLIEMVTNYGTIHLELYNETPLHRDNFLKLVKEKAYDSLLFHRVINQFMIQSGDPDSRKATSMEVQLGNGSLPYKVPAEINKTLFHQRGALGAARDGNPERASSAMQFYIVQRGIQNDSLLKVANKRINTWLGKHYAYKDIVNETLIDAVDKARKRKDTIRYKQLNDSLNIVVKNYTDFTKYTIPEKHRKVYKTVGGTPHLDQNYTVFGQVTKGLDVVDAIATVQTNDSDRPIDAVRILSIQLVDK